MIDRSPPMAFCPNCGAELLADVVKCTQCGAAFGPGSAWKPSLTKPDGASMDDGRPVYFLVSGSKLAVLSFFTFDLYALYWFYQNWKMEKKRTGENLWPLARTFFAPLTAYFLFDGIRKTLERHSMPRIEAGVLALAFLALNMTWRLPDPYSLVSVFMFLPILPVQAAVNRLNARIAPDAPRNERYTAANIAAIVIGGLLWLLVLAGLLMTENFDATR